MIPIHYRKTQGDPTQKTGQAIMAFTEALKEAIGENLDSYKNNFPHTIEKPK
jgi:hypothetical protein